MPIYKPYAGPTVELDTDVAVKLKLGDPALGWEGDPALQLAYNRQTDRIELWREVGDGMSVLVLQSKKGQRVVDMDLIKFLVTHDAQRGYDVAAEIEAHNTKRYAELKQQHEERMEEVSAKLAAALIKDLS